MIEAVAERREGAPKQFRRRWADEFEERAVAEEIEPGQAFQRLHIALAFIHHNSFAGVVMLAPDKGALRRLGLSRRIRDRVERGP
ncbi:hypothetical protein [Agrobacterium larrymoorei]|uniref:hypothetical protein n=1 Tax=Agrobacterium larrymoorei TaxID=160699 RepID=UPI001F1905E7|nr:hypothetical protein [Agrobacterium larrymoorei]